MGRADRQRTVGCMILVESTNIDVSGIPPPIIGVKNNGTIVWTISDNHQVIPKGIFERDRNIRSGEGNCSETR
jgi:hypothetical protein